MPELPEIETLTRSLRAKLIGEKFSDVEFFRDNLREAFEKSLIAKTLVNQKVTSVTRRSKYCLIHTPKGVVAFHLGMSGKLLLQKNNEPTLPHTHVVFKLKDQSALRFIDPRRFGRIFPVEATQLSDHKYFKDLGPEPLEGSVKNLAEHLHKTSRGRCGLLKSFLMDQNIVVGVGNIYASEALYRAGLCPTRKAGTITLAHWEKLAEVTRAVLREAIELGGSTIRDYRMTDGHAGSFQQRFLVYDQAGNPCRNCLSRIRLIRIAGRSSYYCPTCQK